jgi:hypothetical protein
VVLHPNIHGSLGVNTPHNIPTPYQAKININQQLNSDHHLVILNIPSNTLISKKHIPLTNTKIKVQNPIPFKNMEIFKIKFSKNNTNQINTLKPT